MIVNKKTNNNNTGDDDFTMVRSVCLEDSRNKSDDKGCQCWYAKINISLIILWIKGLFYCKLKKFIF